MFPRAKDCWNRAECVQFEPFNIFKFVLCSMWALCFVQAAHNTCFLGQSIYIPGALNQRIFEFPFHNCSCNIIHPVNCLFFRKCKMLWPLVIQAQRKQYKGIEGCYCAIKDVLTLYPAGQLFDKANQHITQLHLRRQRFREVMLLMPVSSCLILFFLFLITVTRPQNAL